MLPSSLARRLRTTHATSATALRRTVQEVLGECVDSDGIVFDRRLVVDGRLWVRDVLHHRCAVAVERMYAELTERPDPLQGPRGMRGLPLRRRDGAGFLGLDALFTRKELEQSPLYRRYYGPLGIQDQLRLFALHGDRLVGWICCFRTRGSAPFKVAQRRLLQPLVQPIVDALAAADRMQADALAPADLVVRPDGTVEHASAAANEWLADESFVRALRVHVRALDSGAEPGTLGPLSTADARTVRLDGASGVRYLVNVVRASPFRLPSAGALTMREQQVADAAAAGATVVEIARSLGSRPETVRSQLKEVYRKLGVASRVELVRALRG